MEVIEIPIASQCLTDTLDYIENKKISDVKLSLEHAILIFKEIISQVNANSTIYDSTESTLTIDMGNLIKLYNMLDIKLNHNLFN